MLTYRQTTYRENLGKLLPLLLPVKRGGIANTKGVLGYDSLQTQERNLPHLVG
jgi:hypothetical protein